MKKIICLVLTIVLALACSVSSFAWLCFDFTWEPTPEGTHLNDYSIGSDIGSLPIRCDWTVSRAPGNAMRNEDCVVIYDEDEEVNVAQFAAPEYMITTDYQIETNACLDLMLKKGVTAGFNGCAYCFDYNDIIPAATNETNQDDYYFTEFPAKNDDGKAAYIMLAGLGFTFLKDSESVIRYYVRCVTDGESDVIYYDLDTGLDLSNGYHEYQFYVESGKVTFGFDGFRACSMTMADAAQVSDLGLKGTYCRTVKIFDGKNQEVAATSTALVKESDLTYANFAQQGEGTICYQYGITYLEDEDVPTLAYGETPPTQAPATDAPDATQAPATNAPKATEEAKATNKPSEENNGCGSLIAGGAFIILAAVSLIARKKEQ